MQRQKASSQTRCKNSVKPCGVNLKAVPKFEDRSMNDKTSGQRPLDPFDPEGAGAEAQGANSSAGTGAAKARRQVPRERKEVRSRLQRELRSLARGAGANAINTHAPAPDRSDDARTAPIEVTFTRRRNGGFVGERWVNPPDVFETIAGGVEWIDEEITCDDLEAVAREVKARAATGEWSVSLGSPREGLDPRKPHRHAAEFYDDAPSRLFWLDIDSLRVPRQLGLAENLEAGADYAVSLMPEPFRKAGGIVLRTTRTGSYPGLLHARVVFLLDEPRTLAEMKAVAGGLAALPEFSPKSGHKIIDTGIYTPSRFVFISAPQCARGVLDPGAKAGMFVKPGPPLDLDDAGQALGVDLAQTTIRARAARSPLAANKRLVLDAPEDQRERLLRDLVLSLPNNLDRNGWTGHLHAIRAASGGAPYGRDIALEFSARWLNGVDDPQESGRVYDTLRPDKYGIDYLTGRAVKNVGTPGAGRRRRNRPGPARRARIPAVTRRRAFRDRARGRARARASRSDHRDDERGMGVHQVAP
jgi:hypothetical protein